MWGWIHLQVQLDPGAAILACSPLCISQLKSQLPVIPPAGSQAPYVGTKVNNGSPSPATSPLPAWQEVRPLLPTEGRCPLPVLQQGSTVLGGILHHNNWRVLMALVRAVGDSGMPDALHWVLCREHPAQQRPAPITSLNIQPDRRVGRILLITV